MNINKLILCGLKEINLKKNNNLYTVLKLKNKQNTIKAFNYTEY